MTSEGQSETIVQRGQRGELECQPGRTMIESFEASGEPGPERADACGLSVQDSISEANNVKSMAMAGSKGNDINISQIIACVGQQNVKAREYPTAFAEERYLISRKMIWDLSREVLWRTLTLRGLARKNFSSTPWAVGRVSSIRRARRPRPVIYRDA